MYRALYRKYRPQTFTDVVGQEAITTALSNQILAGKVGHAYLFTGTRGTGKTTCAKIFAKAVNCEDRDGANPCGACVPCKGLEDGSILDVIEIDAASNNGVDDIRDLRDETAYRPSRCSYKVYIIDEVHMLSTAAFNALLKIMEEPPGHVIFILATTEIHKVPATILSRCQRYDFVRIPAEKIAARLLQVAGEEGIALDEPAADLIARLADGALRDALSLLDTCAGVGGVVDEPLVRRMAGVSDRGYLFEVSEAVAAGDPVGLLALVNTLREKSIDVKRLTEELVHHYRNLMLATARPDGALLAALPADERARYAEASAACDASFCIRAVRRLAAAMDNMGRSPDPRIELELALFDLCAPEAPQVTKAAPAARPAAQTTRQAPRPATASTLPTDIPLAAPVPKPQAARATQPSAPGREDLPPWEMDDTAPPPQEAPPEAEPTKPPLAPPVQPVVQPVQEEQPEQAPSRTAPGVFAPWAEVVQNMAAIDRMLYSYMKGSVAYLEGGRVLIDGGEMFLAYMREYAEAGERIKTVIEQVTGRRYPIGPYTGRQAQTAKKRTVQDTLQEWQAKGVPVEYE